VRSRRDDFSIPPAASDLADDERDFLLAERRRKLGRWVALTVGASIVICIAAILRVVAARTDGSRDAEVVLALPAPVPAPTPAPAPSASSSALVTPAAPADSALATRPKGAGAAKGQHRALDAKCKRLKRGVSEDCGH
jgi:hypothetical protein